MKSLLLILATFTSGFAFAAESDANASLIAIQQARISRLEQLNATSTEQIAGLIAEIEEIKTAIGQNTTDISNVSTDLKDKADEDTVSSISNSLSAKLDTTSFDGKVKDWIREHCTINIDIDNDCTTTLNDCKARNDRVSGSRTAKFDGTTVFSMLSGGDKFDADNQLQIRIKCE